MQHNHTTPGSSPPGVEPSTVEQVLIEVAHELPPVRLPGNLTVVAEVLPYALGRMHPVCTYVSRDGEHSIPTQLVWKDLETNEVYCTLPCAVKDAIAKADHNAEAQPAGAKHA